MNTKLNTQPNGIEENAEIKLNEKVNTENNENIIVEDTLKEENKPASSNNDIESCENKTENIEIVKTENTESIVEASTEMKSAVDENSEIKSEEENITSEGEVKTSEEENITSEEVEVKTSEEEDKTIEKDKELEINIEDEAEEESTVDYSSLSKDDILNKLRILIHETDVNESKREIEALKNQYYKTLNNEHKLIIQNLKEKGGEEITIDIPKDPTEFYLKELLTDYRNKKNEIIQQQQELRLENLSKKEEIIEKIKNLANSEESLNKTFAEFKSLQQEWVSIGQVPSSDSERIWKNYQLQIERFYDFVKINNELRDLDFKRNLEQKVELCEKIEVLLLETKPLIAYKHAQELFNLWRELGPVPADKREEIWDRFNSPLKKIRKDYQDHFEGLKQEREANYQQKVILCEKAEEIVNQAKPESEKQWNDQTKQILELQKIWKTIGMVPNNVNTEIFERFRTSCNKFFETRNETLEKNFREKVEICNIADSIKESSDWKKTTNLLIELQNKWKTIGAVPRKESESLWKRFRASCDHYFNRKSNFFANVEAEHSENQKKKEDLIEEIRSFVPPEIQAECIEKVKEFQARWTEIGYVASSQKDKLYAEFRKAIDAIFEKLNLDRNSLSINNFNTRIKSIKELGNENELSRERSKILRQIQDLNAEILKLENNIGFFSSGSTEIINSFNKKIEKAKSEIKLLKDKKKTIDIAERELKKKSEDDTSSPE